MSGTSMNKPTAKMWGVQDLKLIFIVNNRKPLVLSRMSKVMESWDTGTKIEFSP